MQLPAQIYKYTYKKYAELMAKEGQFRIGTLFEYRDIEKHGEDVGDQKEGTKEIYADNLNFQANRPETMVGLPDFVKNMFKGGVSVQGITVGKQISSNDLYIFSAAELFDEKIMRGLGYDACIKINNTSAFLSELTSSMKKLELIENKPTILGKCVYRDRREHFTKETKIHPALVKEPKHSYQKELRAIWVPSKYPIESMIINNEKAKKYIEII